MPAPFSPYADRLAIAIVGFALLVVALAAFVVDATPEWKDDQERVRTIVRERMGADAAARVKGGIRQHWIEELNRVDRCVTCHTTIDWGAELLDAPHPARSHPRPELLAAHPPERFGCTLCHGGQGHATTRRDAHGNIHFWDEPLLDTRRARRYGLTPAELMEVNCNACHRHDESTEGMPLLQEAKEVVKARRCTRCHVIEGEGGQGEIRGPELTYEGEKLPDRFVFPPGWEKPRTALTWHIEHLIDPAAIVEGSEMPKLRMTDRQRVAVALLMLSWKRIALPPAWIPR
ncbi:MAG: hypothetical protein ACYTG6_07670 [Planctomycetota bacterium]